MRFLKLFLALMFFALTLMAIGTINAEAVDRNRQQKERIRRPNPPRGGSFDSTWQLFECERGAANYVDVPEDRGFGSTGKGASLYSDQPPSKGAASLVYDAPADENFEFRGLQFYLRGDAIERAFIRVTCQFRTSDGRGGSGFTLNANNFNPRPLGDGWFAYTISDREVPSDSVLRSITFTRFDGPLNRPTIVGSTSVKLRRPALISQDLNFNKGKCGDIPN